MSAPRLAASMLFAVGLLLGAAGSLHAQDFDVVAYIQPEQGITDDRPFRLVIQASGSDLPGRIPAPRLPELENLSLIGGPSTSRQVSMINGRTSSQHQLIYTLLADGPGEARIPSLTLTIGSETYTTDPIQIKVSAAASGPPPQSPGTPRGGRGEARQEGPDLFIEATLGSREVWVGEPVAFTVTLYNREEIGDEGVREIPDFADFWVENIATDPNAEKYRATRGGKEYDAYPLMRKVLVPPTPGKFEIGPYVHQFRVVVPGSGRSLFTRRTTSIVRRSEALALTVRQLPAGAPDGFGGAVGSYRLRVELDRERAAVNDAVALRATVEGEGLLRAVGPPVFPALPDLKVFEPKVAGSRTSVRPKVTSRKTWEWLVVPLAPGELRIPELGFVYFEPAKETYEVARGGSPLLAVERGESSPDTAVARGDIRLQRKDLMFIKPLRGELGTGAAGLHRKPWFLALLVLPAALVPLAVVVGRRRARLQADRGLARSRRAGRIAKKRLRAARRRIDQADSAGFHEEVARTLVDFVADRFNRSGAGLTYDLADDLLATRGVGPELRRRFRSTLETCDFARFVPASAKTERRAELLGEAESVLRELEKAC